MRIPALFVACVFFLSSIVWGDWTPPPSLKPSGTELSPDGKTAAVWFDVDLGKQVGLVRTILVTPIPRDDTLFYLVTFPRNTLAAWNPGSSRCLINDAPDNGNQNFWLVERRDAEKWKTTQIDPLRALSEAFYNAEDWDGRHLWRPYVNSVSWLDDKTVQIQAADNKGEYEITLRVDNLKHPHIKKLSAKANK